MIVLIEQTSWDSVRGKINCCGLNRVSSSVDGRLCICNCRSELSANCVAELVKGVSIVNIVWEVVVRGDSKKL